MEKSPATSFPGSRKEALFEALASSAAGLSGSEATLRQQRVGKNQIIFHHRHGR